MRKFIFIFSLFVLSFLVLNTIAAAYGETATPKYERMYSSIVKNIEQGKSNKKIIR